MLRSGSGGHQYSENRLALVEGTHIGARQGLAQKSVREVSVEEATIMTKIRTYQPFPDGEKPEDWPAEYVSLADYERQAQEIERLRAELERIANCPSPECARDPFLCKAWARAALSPEVSK